MALNRPFIFAVQVAVAAGGVNTGSFLVGVGQVFDCYEIYTDNVTVGLNVIGLRDSTGLQYTFAGTANPIPMAQLISPAKANYSNIFLFPKPVNLIGQIIFLVDINNTTAGSLTANLAFKGFMTITAGG